MVLRELRTYYPHTGLYGYEIAPAAARFWPESTSDIHFRLGDFFSSDESYYDVILVLDVVEHVPDPFAFLLGLRSRAKYCVLHIPLDLSAISVLRERPLLQARSRVGHIHYFTKSLALSLLEEVGFRIASWRYTGAGLYGPRRSLRTILVGVPRRIGYWVGKDWAVRAFGGETLLVVAEMDGAPV